MQELIQQAIGKFGVSESQATSAVGGLLRLIQSKSDSADFDELRAQDPKVEEILRLTEEGTDDGVGGLLGGSGLLGGLAGKAKGVLGSDVTSALGGVAVLQKTGLSASQLGPFAEMFVKFLQSKAGGPLVSRLLAKMPELSRFL
jgi:hypothetical protein